jgi:hypothetical protein
MAATPLATPRHLHNNAPHIFGLENVKDGRASVQPRHAIRTTLISIYLVWKILKMAAATSCNATPPAQQWPAYIWFGKF